jgi:hypothetical protein
MMFWIWSLVAFLTGLVLAVRAEKYLQRREDRLDRSGGRRGYGGAE